MLHPILLTDSELDDIRTALGLFFEQLDGDGDFQQNFGDTELAERFVRHALSVDQLLTRLPDPDVAARRP